MAVAGNPIQQGQKFGTIATADPKAQLEQQKQLFQPYNFTQGFSDAWAESIVVQPFTNHRNLRTTLEAATGRVKKDTGWNPMPEIQKLGLEYEPFVEDFLNTKNSEDFLAVKLNVDSRLKRAKRQQSAQVDGSQGYLLGTIFDPAEVAFAIGTYAAGVTGVPTLGLMLGANRLNKTKRLSSTMGAGFTEAQMYAGTDIAVRHIFEQGYSMEDAYLTMGTAGILGAGLGGLGGTAQNLQIKGQLRTKEAFVAQVERDFKLEKPEGFSNTLEDRMELVRNKLNELTPEELDNYFSNYSLDPQSPKKMQARSVGAAAFDGLDGTKAGEFLNKWGLVGRIFEWNPVMPVLRSRSSQARSVLSRLMEHNIPLTTEILGESATPQGAVSTRIQNRMGVTVGASEKHTGAYKKYRRRMIETGMEPLTKEQFNKLTFQTILTNKADNVPAEILEAADAWRNMTKQYKEDALEVGLIKRGNESESYAPVYYDKSAITANPDGFTKAMRAALASGRANVKAKLAKMGDDYKPTKAESEMAALKDSEIEGVAERYTQSIITDSELPPTDSDALNATSKKFKGRELALDYSQLSGFIDTDIENVMSRYSRSIVPDIEVTREFGSLDMADVLEEVEASFGDNLDAAGLKEKELVLENIKFLRDVVRNRDEYSMTTSVGVRNAIKAANAFAFVTTMGMFAVNTIVEAAMPAVIHGTKRAYGPLFKDMRNNFKAMKLSSRDAKALGIAVDVHTGNRMMSVMSGNSTTPLAATKFETQVDKMTASFANLFGVTYLTDIMRTYSMMVNNNSFADNMQKVADFKADSETTRRFASLGLGQDQARIVINEMNKHGEWVTDYNYAPNTDKWSPDARRIYEAALLKAVNNEIMMPNAGDMPKMAQTPAGKVIFFLRSYQFAVGNRVLNRMVNSPSAHTSRGLMYLLGAGALTHLAYEQIMGREIESTDELLYGAINRSGILGVGWEMNNIMDKSFGIGLGDGDRFQSLTNPLEQLGGVTVQRVGDVADFATNPTESKALGLIPAQNYVGLEMMMRVLEE
jgi:hypothetical protein